MKEMKHVKRGMTDEEVNNLTKEKLEEDLETLKENLDEMSRKTERIEKLKEFLTWFEEEIIESGRGDTFTGVFLLGCLATGSYKKKEAFILSIIAALRLTKGLYDMMYNNVKNTY